MNPYVTLIWKIWLLNNCLWYICIFYISKFRLYFYLKILRQQILIVSGPNQKFLELSVNFCVCKRVPKKSITPLHRRLLLYLLKIFFFGNFLNTLLIRIQMSVLHRFSMKINFNTSVHSAITLCTLLYTNFATI